MKTKRFFLIISILLIFFLILIIIKSAKKDYFKVSAEDILQTTLNSDNLFSIKELEKKQKSTNNILLIDLRNTSKYNEFHLQNSINISFRDILNRKSHRHFKKSNQDIILYSDKISESAKAWSILNQMGYRKLYILEIDGDNLNKSPDYKDSLNFQDEKFKYKFQPDTTIRLE